MIRYVDNGNLFTSEADALVDPVNCFGVMGKGIALEFKKRFPEIFPPYKQACVIKKLKPGTLMLIQLVIKPEMFEKKRPAVILFPTKYHWKGDSKLEWIEEGLKYFKEHYQEWGIKSVAMPQIGCGLGKLPWGKVQALIEKYLGDKQIEVEVYLNAVKDYQEFSGKDKLQLSIPLRGEKE